MVRRSAFLFPGQGRLPDSLPPTSPEIERLLDLAETRGLELRTWLVEKEAARLLGTDVAQPFILIDSLARERSLRAGGVNPVLVAGHSLGEYAALVSAGVLSAHDALDVVIERGRLMAGIAGSMAAIVKLDLDTVARLCSQIGSDVVVANHNGTHQVVISGAEASVDRVIELAQAAGGRGIRLEVSGPFHSPFMERAREVLAAVLDRVSFRPPSVPVVCGVSGRVETDPERLRALMKEQMTACVRWVDVLSSLVREGVSHAVEAGSGTVLSGLGRRFTDEIQFVSYEEATDG